MRSDMGKVVIERPRWHSDESYHAQRHKRRTVSTKLKNLRFTNDNFEDFEDDVAHIEVGGIDPIRRRDKNLTDLLGPIKRYLQSQVGVSWDSVWSDVCTNLRGTHAVEHVREHVEQMVTFAGETGRWYKNGVTDYESIKYSNYPRFYVDEDGILRRQLKPIETKRIWLRGSDYYLNNHFGYYRRYLIRNPIRDITGYSFYKNSQDDLLWILATDRLLADYSKKDKLRPEEQKRKENLENFRLYIYDGVEYVFTHGAWFKFEKAKLGDLKVKTFNAVNDKCPVPYSNIYVYSSAKEQGTIFYFYKFYDIMGNCTSTYTNEFDKNSVIRHKFMQVSHSELKRVGLIK